jgi:hypothetical protein
MLHPLEAWCVSIWAKVQYMSRKAFDFERRIGERPRARICSDWSQTSRVMSNPPRAWSVSE